jgi:hypothetical protein
VYKSRKVAAPAAGAFWLCFETGAEVALERAVEAEHSRTVFERSIPFCVALRREGLSPPHSKGKGARLRMADDAAAAAAAATATAPTATAATPPPSDGEYLLTVGSAFPGCAGAAARLRSCAAAHPAGTPTAGACARHSVLVGWCVVRSLCGRESGRLEACCGGVPEIVGCRRRGCAREDEELDRCMRRFTRER